MPAEPYSLAKRFSHNSYLRVTDVADGLDAVGRADLTLMDATIRPLWMGVHFWGPAVTMRVVPTSRTMPKLTRAQALDQHKLWSETGAWTIKLEEHTKSGCVVVTSVAGARETGIWGSNNTMAMQVAGVAGIVTEGQCRDTDEVILQKGPVACRGIGRTIIPGRVELVEMNEAVGCGGVLVRPNDIVGCDWDGCLVVPLDVAEDVLAIAARIAVDDKKKRRALYEKLGRKPDPTVDWESAAEYFKDLL